MKDNMKELQDKFDLVENGNGGIYKCKKEGCGKPCLSVETYFPCVDKYMVTKVRCHLGCGSTWRLQITLAGEILTS